MIQIRNNIFETNSSSIHSLSIYRVDEDGKIGSKIITSDMFKKFGGDTEIGKLGFCINLVFSIISEDYPIEEHDKIKSRVISYFDEILSSKGGGSLDSGIYPVNFSDIYTHNDDPKTVFKKFVFEEFGEDLEGCIDSPQNISTTIKAVTKIIFDTDIRVLDYEVFGR